MNKQIELSSKEKFLLSKYDTVDGRLSIKEMVAKYGLPVVVLKYATVECTAKGVSVKTIPVDKFIDGELHFRDDIVVKGVKLTLTRVVENSGIKKMHVRHPRYNASNMPTATAMEILKWKIKDEKKETEG